LSIKKRTFTSPNAQRSAPQSQGETIEKAVENLKEATELYPEEFPLNRSERSFVTTFEVAKVAGT
jgi:hypothetical protein